MEVALSHPPLFALKLVEMASEPPRSNVKIKMGDQHRETGVTLLA